MNRHLFLLLVIASGVAGCAGPDGRHDDFWHPGNIQTQRLRAIVHDPYPDQDLGPVVMGGRPRDFAEPLPEAVRNRIYSDSFGGR